MHLRDCGKLIGLVSELLNAFARYASQYHQKIILAKFAEIQKCHDLHLCFLPGYKKKHCHCFYEDVQGLKSCYNTQCRPKQNHNNMTPFYSNKRETTANNILQDKSVDKNMENRVS